MEVDSLTDRWMKFKERFGCCGGIFRMAINMVQPDEEDDEDDSRISQPLNLNQIPLQGGINPSWMSLAMALAAERELHGETQPGKASLMRLLEDTQELANHDEDSEMVCCVCMMKRKGAAFIPCGHTFCRGCARQVWVFRGTCPLCNGNIHEILHIY